MAEELRELRLDKKLPAREMVSVVREIYPKYDKTMQSKCERGHEYGIRIRQDALEALYAKFAPDKLQENEKKKTDGHKLRCRISCRLPDEVYAELQKHIKEDGYKTMQDWLTYTVDKYIQRKKELKKGEFLMAKTIVGINYKNKNTGEFSGRTYNYFCEIDAKVGDLVKAPTAKGHSTAKVSEVNVPESQVDANILPILKTITEFAESEDE